jgi:pyruvate formate lyase activating enzyme
MESGLIFDIKHYAINDGPGIRVTVFLKGCPLRCKWCHNPESISPRVQKLYTAKKCIFCSECVTACPENAIQINNGVLTTDSELCTLCGLCAEACPTNAIEMAGEEKAVEEIMEIVEKDRIFFEQSGGGVTFSGGEPLMQAGFLLALLKASRERGIHTTVDTSGFCATETLLKVAEFTDHFLYDIKVIDDSKHREYTGVGNELILKNLIALSSTGAGVSIRIPLIKGINDDKSEIEAMAAFINSLEGEQKEVNLLPFHYTARNKYEKLGQAGDESGLAETSHEEQQAIIDTFKELGLSASIGG